MPGVGAPEPHAAGVVQREKEEAVANLRELIPFLIPIAILQLGLVIFALMDVARREKTRGPKWMWVLVILFVNLIGPVAYLIFGREE